MLGCRYRLVADVHGCRLSRTWFGIPWSRRSFGRRARITMLPGWGWEELSIVPEHPRDGADRFVVMEYAAPSEATRLHADAADRAIEVAVARAASTYRRPAD